MPSKQTTACISSKEKQRLKICKEIGTETQERQRDTERGTQRCKNACHTLFQIAKSLPIHCEGGADLSQGKQ